MSKDSGLDPVRLWGFVLLFGALVGAACGGVMLLLEVESGMYRNMVVGGVVGGIMSLIVSSKREWFRARS